MKKYNGYTLTEILFIGIFISLFLVSAYSFYTKEKQPKVVTGINLEQAQPMPKDVDLSSGVLASKPITKNNRINENDFDSADFSNDFDKNDMGLVVTKMRKVKNNNVSKTDEKQTSNQKSEINKSSGTVCCYRNNISSSCLIPTDKEFMTKSECEAKKDKLGIKNCVEGKDYWAKGVEKCGHISKMVDEETLAKIANDVYKVNHKILPREGNTTVSGVNEQMWKKYFGNEKDVGIWANVESGGNYVGRSHWRYFGKPDYSGDLGSPAGQTGWRGNGTRSLNSETRYTYCICN